MRIAIITGIFLILLSHLARADEHIDGVYDMQIKIGETTFNDELELKATDVGFFMNSELTGFVTVPGVFKAELKGTVKYNPWSDRYMFNFTILASENGQEFKVEYRGTTSFGVSDIQGSACLEDGKLLGNFTAVKRK